MDIKRSEIQKQMVINQIAEVQKISTQISDAIDVDTICGRGFVIISRATASRALRNLEDFKKRFLMGQVQEG